MCSSSGLVLLALPQALLPVLRLGIGEEVLELAHCHTNLCGQRFPLGPWDPQQAPLCGLGNLRQLADLFVGEPLAVNDPLAIGPSLIPRRVRGGTGHSLRRHCTHLGHGKLPQHGQHVGELAGQGRPSRRHRWCGRRGSGGGGSSSSSLGCSSLSLERLLGLFGDLLGLLWLSDGNTILDCLVGGPLGRQAHLVQDETPLQVVENHIQPLLQDAKDWDANLVHVLVLLHQVQPALVALAVQQTAHLVPQLLLYVRGDRHRGRVTG
mmetsp:Transcript_35487/g.89480  ORF Transcript_35487/g.89480 Transcript_35487/m.89480 type:complete len:265 (-) Transcript_35487:179-973(-)